mgnify:CR=1 FL=1
MKKYCVLKAWGIHGNSCIIKPADNYYLARDNWKLTTSAGKCGTEIHIYDTLEDAIINANYDPNKRIFNNLNAFEMAKKDVFLSRCTWDSAGLKVVR